MKIKRNWFLLTIVILCYFSVFFHFASLMIISFNLFGLMDMYQSLMSEYLGVAVDLSADMTFLVLEYMIAIVFDLQCAKAYKKVYKYSALKNDSYYRVGSQRLIQMSIFQMLISSFPIGVCALITGIVLGRKGARMSENKVTTSAVNPEIKSDVPDYKLKAMGEAINRLKELRSMGVISEEEYFENLNKILEG